MLTDVNTRTHTPTRITRLALLVAAAATLLSIGCGKAPAPAGDPVAAPTPPGSDAPRDPTEQGPNQKAYWIRSNPGGASIYVDGKLIGKAPAKYYGPLDGQHLVHASLDGYLLSGMYTALEGDELTIDLVQGERATDSQRQAVARRNLLPAMTVLQTDAGKAWLVPPGGGATGPRLISPDGRYLAAIAYTEEGLARRQDLVVLDLQKGESRRVATRTYERHPFGTDDAAFGFYPVGWAGSSQLLVLTQRTLPDDPNNPALSVLRLDLVTGEQKVIGDLGRYAEGLGYVKRAWLTSDGQGLFVHLPGRLLGLNAAKGGPLLVGVTLPGYDGMFWVEPSPDGWTVAYQILEGPSERRIGRIYLLDLKTGQRRAVSSEEEYAERISWSPDGTRLAYGVGYRRADGSFPIYQDSDWSPLVPDAFEIIDLPVNWHTADEGNAFNKRKVEIAGSSLSLVGWNSPDQMLLATVTVGAGQDPVGWRLEYRGLVPAEPATGTTGQVFALPGTVRGYIEAVRNDAGGYLIALAGESGDRTLRLKPDGSVSDLGAFIAGAGRALQASDAPWLVQTADGGVVDASGQRVLPPTAGEGPFFFAARGGGWVVLTRWREGSGDQLFILRESLQ